MNKEINTAILKLRKRAEKYSKEQLIKNGLRADADIRNEKIGYKIREHSNAKIPVILAVGKKEAEEKTVSVRRLGSQNTTVVKLEELINDLKKESLSPN